MSARELLHTQQSFDNSNFDQLFFVEDLLDLSNKENDQQEAENHDVNGNDNNFTNFTNSSIITSSNRIYSNSSFDHSLNDVQLSGELDIPQDDLAELEWRLTTFNEDSFSSEELQKMQLISGIMPQVELNSSNHSASQVESNAQNIKNRSNPVFIRDRDRDVQNSSNSVLITDPVFIRDSDVQNSSNPDLVFIKDCDVQNSNNPVLITDTDVQIPVKTKTKHVRTKRSRRLVSSNNCMSDISKSAQDILVPMQMTQSPIPHTPIRRVTKKKESDDEVRKCLHCDTEKTPQWRTGPLGPKTLCNACGVRYKSGRLVPEYRPAASPTFVLTKHSNSHRKVMELRRQKELKSQVQQNIQNRHHSHQQLFFHDQIFDMPDPIFDIGNSNEDFLNPHMEMEMNMMDLKLRRKLY